MNIMLALTLFIIIILIYWIITELFTMLFRLTGLPEDKARFQVISLITGSGFTTRESEMVISTPGRRQLARFAMLFGYVFNVTIVSALVNIFFSLKLSQMENFVFELLIPLLIVLVLILLLRVRAIRSWIDGLMEFLAGRLMHRESPNTVLLLDYIGHDSIAQVTLRVVPPELRDLPLSENGLKPDKNILVMLVERKGRPAEAATASTVFKPGDKLTVFGRYDTICSTFLARESFADH